MANRAHATTGGKPFEAMLRGLIEANSALSKRVKRLETIASNQTAPPGTRFGSMMYANSGELCVWLERVDTGERMYLFNPPPGHSQTDEYS